MNDLDVLVIDADADVRLGCVVQVLGLEGLMKVLGVASVEEAQARSATTSPASSPISACRGGKGGLAFLREVVAGDSALPVILITGHGDVATDGGAMRDGAYDFIQKPFSSQLRWPREKRAFVLEVRGLRRRLRRGQRP